MTGAERCRRKFLRIFPGGFRDESYVDLERDYKWSAHKAWRETLDAPHLAALIDRTEYQKAALEAVRIESRTNLLFSFEKMALRDAVRTDDGAATFARALYAFLYGREPLAQRFDAWCAAVESLPRRQTRVLTWPLLTVFGFIAQPRTHIFLKPNVTRIAAKKYGFDFHYASRPSWPVYDEYLALASAVKRDLRDLRPRHQIDIQSFLWIQGSDEY